MLYSVYSVNHKRWQKYSVWGVFCHPAHQGLRLWSPLEGSLLEPVVIPSTISVSDPDPGMLENAKSLLADCIRWFDTSALFEGGDGGGLTALSRTSNWCYCCPL